MQRVVLNSAWLTIAVVDGPRPIARIVRSTAPFTSVDEAGRAFEDAARALDELGRARTRLFVDLRAGPSRNDPEFETMMRAARRRLMADIPRVAILVRSAVGVLQLERQQRDGTGDPHVRTFQDEHAALRYLERA